MKNAASRKCFTHTKCILYTQHERKKVMQNYCGLTHKNTTNGTLIGRKEERKQKKNVDTKITNCVVWKVRVENSKHTANDQTFGLTYRNCKKLHFRFKIHVSFRSFNTWNWQEYTNNVLWWWCRCSCAFVWTWMCCMRCQIESNSAEREQYIT